MKVALINPGSNIANDSPPINLGILAACLEKEDYETQIIDVASGDDFLSKIEAFNPDFAGITSNTPSITQGYRFADICREKGIWTIMGGVHPSVLPEEALKHADTIVVGEGEIVLPRLIKTPQKGIIKGQIVKDLDSLPMPAYHLLNMEFYTTIFERISLNFMSFVSRNTRMGTLLTSRGCPYNCTFCHNSYRGLPFRFNSPERVIEELGFLIDKYRIKGLFFVEDNIFCNQPRLREICRLMKEERIDLIWGGNSRVDNINKDILRIAKSAGCKQITFGWESGSQRILDILNKRTTIEQNRKSIELCNEAGIWASGTVMLGNPTETEEEIRLTQRFIIENDIKGPVGICVTTPYPGTKIWEWCKEQKRIPSNFKWEDFDFHHVPIPMTDIPLKRFIELVNESTQIVIDKFKYSRFLESMIGR